MVPPVPRPELPILHVLDAGAWEDWLAEHHSRSAGVRLKVAKRDSGERSVSAPEALQVAICFGWIDGRVGRLDDHFWLQRYAPRGPSSRWSQVNRQHALDLIEAGRMREPGLAEVRAAQADGRWEAAYEPQSRATVPDDLQRALDAHPRAAEFFATLTGSRRYAFLYRLHNVKTPRGRAQRIVRYIELLEQSQTLN